MPRATCEGCKRPVGVCLCAHLLTVRPRTKVVVVQHPRERDNPIGTAWMVERCLSAQRIVGVEVDADPTLRAALSDPAAPPILLAPGPSAIDLRAHPPARPVTLVVVDGTWAHARKLLRVNLALAALPRYAFQPARPSNYRIRREPAEHCVSTIEATVAALACLEPESTEVPSVLGAFDAMVELQLRIAAERAENRHLHAAITRAERGPRPRRLPLTRAGLVVAYGEASAWPRTHEHGPHPELVHFVAERLSTGERFEAFVAPERPLSPSFTVHTGVPRERVLGGEPRATFRARLSAFLREGDRLGVFGFYAVGLIEREGLALPPRVDLRSTAIRYLGHRAGDPVELAAALGCPEEAPWALGRTGLRQAAATRIARALSS